MHFFCYFLLSFLLINPLNLHALGHKHHKHKKQKISDYEKFKILRCRYAGMFSVMDDVWNLLRDYENHRYQGIEINFENEGVYYCQYKGLNWWNYYFEPVCWGNRINQDFDYLWQGDPEKHASRQGIKSLCDKYIVVKPEIQKAIEDFATQNFHGHYTVGVHYRGTDKYTESPPVNYMKMMSKIDEAVKNSSDPNCRIFLATDEQAFLELAKGKYGNKLCYQSINRSSTGKPIHIFCKDPYISGKDALTDMILLSKTDYLLRTASNLSRWSTYWNPCLPVYVVKP